MLIKYIYTMYLSTLCVFFHFLMFASLTFLFNVAPYIQVKYLWLLFDLAAGPDNLIENGPYKYVS